MFEKNFKFPRFFIYMLAVIAAVLAFTIFFNVKVVGNTYFIALLVCVVYFIVDKANKSTISNYKLTFFLYEVINLIAVIAILVYEFNFKWSIINVLLWVLFGTEIVLMLLDVFIIKNKNISKKEAIFIDLVKIGSMICITTYFYKVSTLWFAIIGLAFELANLVLKLIFNFASYKKADSIEEEPDSEIEKIISSAGEDEGDIE